MVALQMLLVAGVLGAGNGGETVLLNFTQASCPPCRAMAPLVDQLSQSGLPIRTIDVEQHPELARRFRVAGTPTFVMLVEGHETNRIVGTATGESLYRLFPREAEAPGEVRGQSPDTLEETTEPDNQFAAAPSTRPEPFAVRQIGYDAPAPARAETAGVNPQQRAMAATVRLKVEDDRGFSIGSGTIIDTHENEAVLITCAHIFRDSKGEGRISVDLFYPQQQTVEGKLLDYDLDRDIAIVSIAPGPGVVAAAVASAEEAPRQHAAAFCIGCDKGADPTTRETRINSLNRYQGPPNIQAAGQPVDGRSGGGLFASNGALIGVCNAADPTDDEGIYAALETIHGELKKVGLGAITQKAPPAAPVAALPAEHYVSEEPSEFAREMQPIGNPLTASADEGMELIVIARSKNNPAAKKQVILIQNASADLLHRLAEGASNSAVASDLVLQADRRNDTAPISSGPQLRGQSRR